VRAGWQKKVSWPSLEIERAPWDVGVLRSAEILEEGRNLQRGKELTESRAKGKNAATTRTRNYGKEETQGQKDCLKRDGKQKDPRE